MFFRTCILHICLSILSDYAFNSQEQALELAGGGLFCFNVFKWYFVPAGSQVEILELQDLEKECMLARIRLTLAQHDSTTAAITGKIVWYKLNLNHHYVGVRNMSA